MIPLSIIAAALQLLTEALRAFNGLSQETRDALVNDMLSDKQARDAWLAKATAWWTKAWAKVQLNA